MINICHILTLTLKGCIASPYISVDAIPNSLFCRFVCCWDIHHVDATKDSEPDLRSLDNRASSKLNGHK